jgi:hypothetical protein
MNRRVDHSGRQRAVIGSTPRTAGTCCQRTWDHTLWRARLGMLCLMSLALLAATHAPPARAALDPAAAWRMLLTAAGCPPELAHDLSVRVERLAGPPATADPDDAITTMQRAEQITHLAGGRHGLQLTTAQLDAALTAIFGSAAPSGEGGVDRGAPSTPAARSPPAPAAAAPTEPFTTRHAARQLREWLPTPAPR